MDGSWRARSVVSPAAVACWVGLACSNANALPKVGQPAPDFAVVDETGQPVRLLDLRGSPVVLYSYPKDDTPGCTVEARNFNAALPQLTSLGVVVLGVSGQDAESHRAFKHKHGISFPLLVDADRKLMRAYGMWNGVMASRSTVLIGPDGKVAAVWSQVNPATHDQEVLEAVRTLLPAPRR